MQHRNYKLAAGFALVLALTAAPAHAGTTLNLTRADRLADREARYFVEDWNDLAAELAEDWASDPEGMREEEASPPIPYAVGYDLDPCERVSRKRAECDVTFWLEDGDACDAIFDARLTRRGRMIGDYDSVVCDSGYEDV